MATQNASKSLKTLQTSKRILDTVQELDGVRVTELAEELDLATSTAHGYLSTLEDIDFLYKEGDVYHIGLEFLDKGGYARERKKAYGVVRQKVVDVAEKTGERSQFKVEEHGQAIYLYTHTGSQAVQMDARAGKKSHLHASAAGKAILAELPVERQETIVEAEGLPALTENTVTDATALKRELQTIRERGYAINKQESITGLNAVGVPIKEQNGDVLGAISVSGPANRLRGERLEEEIPSLLLGVVNELELNIPYL